MRSSTRYALMMTACTCFIILSGSVTVAQVAFGVMGTMFLILSIKELEKELSRLTEQADL